MQDGSLKQLFVVAVTVLVVTGMVPAVTAGAFTQEPTEPRAAISGSDFVDASDDIEVWNRAPFPLRTNPEQNADTVIKNVDPFVEVTSFNAGKVRLNKDKVAVYDDSAEIQLQFQSGTGYGTSNFQGQDVQLVAAHIEEDTQAAREIFSSSSTLTTASALDLLTGDNVNDDVHFDVVEDYGTLDSNGEIVRSYDLGDEDRGAGFYVFFLVQDYQGSNTWGVTDDGFEEANGELDVENKSRVLGVDVATVHQRPATADIQSQGPGQSNTFSAGDDLTFDVNAQQDGGDVTHAVVVYNQRNFENKDVTLTVDGDLEDLSADDVTVEREIKDVNGVATISGSPSVFGLGNLQDGRTSGVISGARLIDFVAEQAQADGPLDETTDDAVTLDASVTVIDGDNTEEVTVETFENWTTGRYGYLYVATGDNSREITTTRGELTITPAQSRPNQPSQSRNIDNGRASFSRVSNDISTVNIDFGEGANGNVKLTQRTTPGDGAPTVRDQEDKQDPLYFDIEVPGNLRNQQSTIEVTVRKSSLDGLSPRQVSLWHYKNNRWNELTTLIQSENDTYVTLTATTDGFSPFSVAESTGRTQTVDESNEVDDSGSSSVSSSGGGGVSTGSRTLFSVTKLLYGGTSLSFDVDQSSETLHRIDLTFSEETAGQTAVSERERPQADRDYPRNYDTVLTVVDTEPPNQVADLPGRVTFALKRSAVDAIGVSPDQLQIQQYNSETGTWETLSTDVVAEDSATVTLGADVSRFGTFIVSTVPEGESQVASASSPTATETPSTSTEPTAEPPETQTGTATIQPDERNEQSTTDTEFPGLGISVTLLAFVFAVLLWRRRQ